MASKAEINRAYRRGAVLGLTLAEIMLLVLFLLLLIFSVVFKKEHDLRVEKERELSLISKNKTNYENIVIALDQSPPEMLDELVEAVEGMPYINQLIKKDNLKDSKSETLQQVLIRGIEKLSADKKASEQPISKLDIQSQLKQAILTQNELKDELTNQKNQNLNLIHKLNKDGTGAGYPPCWADSKGRPEYIFNVSLYSDGILIHDNKLSNRTSDEEKLPISMITYDSVLDSSNFRSQTMPLYKWSESNNCRFYVRIYDETDANEKLLYKKQLRVVEEAFYKFLYTG